jgi:hypothetical protein
VNTGGSFGLAAHDLSGFRGIRLSNTVAGTASASLDLSTSNNTSASAIIITSPTGSTGLIDMQTDEVRPVTAKVTRFGTASFIWGSSYVRHMWLPEDAAAPASPTSGTELSMRMCGDKFVITFNDAGTVRYKSFDLTGTNITWAQATSPPAGC